MFKKCVCSGLYSVLSICIRKWLLHWAEASVPDVWVYTSGTDACTEHMHQELMLALIICIRKFCHALIIRINSWCVHWAYASGTDACTEHTHQELMPALSIRIRNWCLHWAYASGTDACTIRTRDWICKTPDESSASNVVFTFEPAVRILMILLLGKSLKISPKLIFKIFTCHSKYPGRSRNLKSRYFSSY